MDSYKVCFLCCAELNLKPNFLIKQLYPRETCNICLSTTNLALSRYSVKKVHKVHKVQKKLKLKKLLLGVINDN